MEDISQYWFRTLKPADWFRRSDELDAQIRERFESTYYEVVAGETSMWRDSAAGRLAEIIVLDQFSRNMFRNSAAAFAADPLALALAQEAVRCGDDKKLEMSQRVFVYMPYMHSESAIVHETAMQLFQDTPNFQYEVKHKDIIDQFGRYPHRNTVLDRTSTADELAWMKSNKGF